MGAVYLFFHYLNLFSDFQPTRTNRAPIHIESRSVRTPRPSRQHEQQSVHEQSVTFCSPPSQSSEMSRALLSIHAAVA